MQTVSTLLAPIGAVLATKPVLGLAIIALFFACVAAVAYGATKMLSTGELG
jgi:hypothetical protein